MIKYTHTYTNYLDESVTEELRFHLRRDELAKNMHLRDEFEEMDRISKEKPRELTAEETRKMFLLIEELMRLTYGALSDDGRLMKKNQAVWENFFDAAVYESFIFWLFEDTERANDFMVGLMPPELREEAAKLALEQNGRGAPIEDVDIEVYEPPEKPKKEGKKKRKEPSHEELLAAWKKKEEERANG